MNWGKSIILVFVVFAAFIGSMVYIMVGQRVDLVRADYYQDEIAYQKQIDRVARTAHLSNDPALTVDLDRRQLALHLPPGWTNGKLTFYRPSNGLQDRTIQLFAGQQLVPTEGLAKGFWRAQLSWSAGGDDYYYEQTFTQP
ncbi:FixH family protein [Fibrella forsythiae]|uniref:FixH family protein n=1 Tax=Fibrella forsythiae TaxID=2817061 RepID=A0ABS3JJ13_9BACT|nr:FixH family protein [Fibrella forsythiae]MBO0949408.1 FixH family protein [Fibrella forsythiae]